MKTCSKCKSELPIEEFHKDRTHPDGHRYQCKNCRKEYQIKNKEKARARARAYRRNNLDKIRERDRAAKRHCHEKTNTYMRKRRKDPTLKTIENIRRRINHALKGSFKINRTVELIGCSPRYLKDWLAGQFTVDMNWGNQGAFWHIDHIVPCSFWDLSKAINQRRCFNYNNLQPKKALENRMKSDSMSWSPIQLEVYTKLLAIR